MVYVLQFGEKAHTRVHHQGSRPDVVNAESGFVSKRHLRLSDGVTAAETASG